uniref:Uncharacterized protein n=1 Tax=Arundo donax TaxID=35708 RepID=A0A0A9C3E9_ARUDO
MLRSPEMSMETTDSPGQPGLTADKDRFKLRRRENPRLTRNRTIHLIHDFISECGKEWKFQFRQSYQISQLPSLQCCFLLPSIHFHCLKNISYALMLSISS